MVASCGFARDGILTAERVVLPCCGCERLLPSIAEVGEYYTEIALVQYLLMSDPISLQSEHKIQSGKGSLVVEMDQVPKILKPMVDEWSPEGFVVSFKVRIIIARLMRSSRNRIFTSVTSSKQIPTSLFPRLEEHCRDMVTRS